MRCSRSMLSTATAAMHEGVRQTSMALLPPLSLYRRVLRAHRKHIPAEMRLLGDEYVKSEFRHHRKVDNPALLVYVQQVEGNAWVGDKVDEVMLGKMSDEQIQQLYDLMQAIKKFKADGASDT